MSGLSGLPGTDSLFDAGRDGRSATNGNSRETGMQATGFERPAALFAAVSLAATIAAFAVGPAQAQTVNPVPAPPPPTFNPSTPGTVPQAPEAPVAPTPPSSLPGAAPAPASPAIGPEPATPAVVPPPTPPAVVPAPAATPAVVPPLASPPVVPPLASPAATPPPAVTPRTTDAPAAAVRHRASRRHARFHAARPLGPSYYPGLGEFYPPSANPCRFSRAWNGDGVGFLTYSCW
jgi:hypothetical protein